MPRVSQDWLRAQLRCPCGGHPRDTPLLWDGDTPRCADPACPGAAGFPLLGTQTRNGQPALIDFADSVIDREGLTARAGASPLRRGNRLRHWVRRTAYGENPVASGNADRLLALLNPVADPVLLIIGGGEHGVGTGALRDAPVLRRAVFDIYATPATDFVADAHAIPLADASVDAVWIQAVLEHVLDPHRVAGEIHRVLRPDGLVYAETPFMQQVHEGAYDFTRFTESGHRWLFRRFALLDSGAVSGLGTSLIWAIRALMTGLTRSRKAGEALTLPFFWLRLLDRAGPRGLNADGASGVFFLGRRSDGAITPRQAIEFYQSRR